MSEERGTAFSEAVTLAEQAASLVDKAQANLNVLRRDFDATRKDHSDAVENNEENHSALLKRFHQSADNMMIGIVALRTANEAALAACLVARNAALDEPQRAHWDLRVTFYRNSGKVD